MSTVKSRTGRPMKAARRGRRYQIGVIVTGETKAVITKAAMETGRTISREVEHMIERCLQYDRTLAAMGKTFEEIKQGNLEAALLRDGYTVERRRIGDKTWKAYREPGYPPVVSGGAVVSGLASEEESR